MSDTIAAIATGNCLSAIGIIRLSGDNAISCAEKLFTPMSGKPLSSYGDRVLVLGRLRDVHGEVLDNCMCVVSRGPSSYTGENTAEFQCHGSPTVLRLVLENLFALGCRQALPGEFTKRAFLNGRLDLSQAEAVIDLIEADTPTAAKNAAAQLEGAVSRRTGEIYHSLLDVVSHYYAVLDYPDEDIDDFKAGEYSRVFVQAIEDIENLLSTGKRGQVMKSGALTAVVGRPNAGKSSLMNALLGYDRAIVTDTPGTTRDTIEESVILGGVKLRLTDTAGIRGTLDRIESAGVDRALAAAKKAELVLVLVDPGDPYPEDWSVLAAVQEAPRIILVFTKSDLHSARADLSSVNGLRVDAAVSLSSHTGHGLKDLEEAVKDLFPEQNVPAGELITNPRQTDALSRALDSLKLAQASLEGGAAPDAVVMETEAALSALGEITGSTLKEDVVSRIFERFCVGK